MYLMKAVKEIQVKVSKEIAENNKIDETLCYEILNAVKEASKGIPNMKDLPMEEKKKILKQAIMDGIQLNPDMSDMDDTEIKAAVDNIFDLFAKTWKTEN